MKNQTTTDVRMVASANPVTPELTRGLRASIRSANVAAVFQSAGARRIVGTPAEVLEEIVAYQTAAWLSAPGATQFTYKALPGSPAVTEAAARAIDEGALADAVRPFLSAGQKDLASIRANLIDHMAQVAVEAARFAASESRPLSHAMVAVGAVIAARKLRTPETPTPRAH